MTEDLVIFLGQETLKTTALVSAPLLISALVVGLLVSFFQAVTQINEATLTFIPKMMIIALVILLGGTWMLDTLVVFTKMLFENLADWVRT